MAKNPVEEPFTSMKHMISILAFVGLGGWLAWAAGPDESQLTKQERAQGWRMLFNGIDTSGWANRDAALASNWEASDGVLTLRKPGRDSDLVYAVEPFADFELSLDWKAEGGGGVFMRLNDPKEAASLGWEVPIGPKKGNTLRSAGALSDLLAPSAAAVVNENDWNHFDITCRGAVISCKMNGVETFRVDLKEEPGKGNSGNPKLTSLGLPRKGWITLRDQGSSVAFRNVRIKPLPATPMR